LRTFAGSASAAAVRPPTAAAEPSNRRREGLAGAPAVREGVSFIEVLSRSAESADTGALRTLIELVDL
jgi:hypothetical protein